MLNLKRLISVGMFVSLLSLQGIAFAQSVSSTSSQSADTRIQAVISGPDDIAVGRTVVLDGSLSHTTGENPSYQWFIEGRKQPISDTVEAIYTPDKAGQIIFHLIVRASLSDGTQLVSETLHPVTVYDRKIVLVADGSVSSEKLAAQRQSASEAGLYLRILHASGAVTPLTGEDHLAAFISEHSTALNGADSIVLWTESITGLQSLVRALQGQEDLRAGLRSQHIILITEGGLRTLSRIAWGPFAELQPQAIIITRPEALGPLFTTPSISVFLEQITQRDIGILQIDASSVMIRPWNVLSWFVNTMLARGVPSQTVILLLVLPVIAMILAFLKQVIGITTLGLYTPAVIALSFLALGWPLGVVFLLFIIATGYGTRALVRKLRLLYIPKVAIVLTVVSLTLLVLMGVGVLLFDFTFTRETIFILLIMSTLAESFLTLKTEQGMMQAISGVGETVLAALLCVFIVQWNVFQSIILAYPELILLTIIVDVLLGRWTGLRLVEYFRFKEVFKHLQEE
jgi:hypothetical protein